VRHVAELAQGGEAGRFRILAAVDPFLDADGEVAADFLVEVIFMRTQRGIGHGYMSSV
jgi:hypothetical protein